MAVPQWRQYGSTWGNPLGLDFLITPLQLLREAANASRVPAQVLDALAAVQAAYDQAQTLVTSRRAIGFAAGALIRALIAPYFTDGAYVITHSNLGQLVERVGVDALLRNRLRPADLREDTQYPGLQTSYAYTRPSVGNLAQGKLLQVRNSALDLLNDVPINEFTDWLDGVMAAFYDEGDVNRPQLFDAVAPGLPTVSEFGGFIFTVEGVDPSVVADRVRSLLQMFRVPDNLRIRLFELDMPEEFTQSTYNGPLQQVRLWNPAERRREIVTTVSPDFNRISTADLLQLLDPILNGLMFSADVVGAPWPISVNLDGIGGGLSAAWLLLNERLETWIRALQTFRDVLSLPGVSVLYLPPEATSLDEFVSKVYSSSKTRDDMVRVLANPDQVGMPGTLRGDLLRKSQADALVSESSSFRYGPAGNLAIAGVGIFFQRGPLADLLELLFNPARTSDNGDVSSVEYRTAVNVTLQQSPTGTPRTGLRAQRRPRQAVVSTAQVRNQSPGSGTGTPSSWADFASGGIGFSADMPDLARVYRRWNTGSETSDRVWATVPTGYSPSGSWADDVNVKLVNGYRNRSTTSAWGQDAVALPIPCPISDATTAQNRVADLPTGVLPVFHRVVAGDQTGGTPVSGVTVPAGGCLLRKTGLRQSLLLDGLDITEGSVWADVEVQWVSGAVCRVRTQVVAWLDADTATVRPALPSAPLASLLHCTFHGSMFNDESLSAGRSDVGVSAEVHCRMEPPAYLADGDVFFPANGSVASGTHAGISVVCLSHIVAAASSPIAERRATVWGSTVVGTHLVGSGDVWPALEYSKQASAQLDQVVGHASPVTVSTDDTPVSGGWTHVHVSCAEARIGVGTISKTPFFLRATAAQIAVSTVVYERQDGVWTPLGSPFASVVTSSGMVRLEWSSAARTVANGRPAVLVFGNPPHIFNWHHALRSHAHTGDVCTKGTAVSFIRSVAGGGLSVVEGCASPGFGVDHAGVSSTDGSACSISAPGTLRVHRQPPELQHRQLEVDLVSTHDSLWLHPSAQMNVLEGLTWRVSAQTDWAGRVWFHVHERGVTPGIGLSAWSLACSVVTDPWPADSMRTVRVAANPNVLQARITVTSDTDTWTEVWSSTLTLEGHPVDGGRVLAGKLTEADSTKTQIVPVSSDDPDFWYSVYPSVLVRANTSVQDPASV